MKRTILVTSSLILLSLHADSGKGNFLAQQAYDETRRLAGQVDVIQNNVDDHAARLLKLERGNGGDVAALNARISALEASNADLRRKMDVLRSEITAELSRKIDQIVKSQPKPRAQPATGPHKVYIVQSGDTLSLVAEAFGTTVKQLCDMNGLKDGSMLRIGQKLKVPMK